MSDDLLDFDEPGAPGDGGSSGDGSGSTGGTTIDWGIIGGLVTSFAALLIGMIMEGTSPLSFISVSAFIIVIIGTMGATLTSVGLENFMKMPRTFMKAVTYEKTDRSEAITTLVAFAEKARREGLLVLEDDLQAVGNEFLRKGVQLVVDGTDPELVKEILQTEVDSLAEEHSREASTWTTTGGYSPTLGIIGTVMGLVNVLGNLSDAKSLGPAIAVAFIATLYGVGVANLVYLPIGTKLGICSGDEIAGRELMIEGILSIQSGDNPRIVEEKLVAFLEAGDKAEFRASRESEDEFDLAA
jgi:chemotaxis protein MotA